MMKRMKVEVGVRRGLTGMYESVRKCLELK
jgi:hypothetical protein